jgi:adenosylmethionine-8-amino-7-oxononanoate aminotransferase
LQENQQQFRKLESIHRKLAAEKLGDSECLKARRFCGTIFAAEVDSGEEGNYFHSLAPIMKKRFVEKGFLIRPLGNTLYLMPPYCISEEALEGAYGAIREVLDQIAGNARC